MAASATIAGAGVQRSRARAARVRARVPPVPAPRGAGRRSPAGAPAVACCHAASSGVSLPQTGQVAAASPARSERLPQQPGQPERRGLRACPRTSAAPAAASRSSRGQLREGRLDADRRAQVSASIELTLLVAVRPVTSAAIASTSRVVLSSRAASVANRGFVGMTRREHCRLSPPVPSPALRARSHSLPCSPSAAGEPVTHPHELVQPEPGEQGLVDLRGPAGQHAAQLAVTEERPVLFERRAPAGVGEGCLACRRRPPATRRILKSSGSLHVPLDARLGADALLHELDDEAGRQPGVHVAPALLPLGAALGCPPRTRARERDFRSLGKAALAGAVATDRRASRRALASA